MTGSASKGGNRSGLIRWMRWAIFVLVFTLACVWLSQWQFDRRNEVVARNLQISSSYSQPALPLVELLPSLQFEPKKEWRPVELSGRYLPETAQLVRNRPFNGQPGFEQVVVFQTNENQLILVNRGWLPTGSAQDSPDVVPTPPIVEQTIVGRVRADETIGGKSAPPQQLPVINSEAAFAYAFERVEASSATVVTGLYLRLASESKAVSPSPRIYTMPELSERNHLSYAIQWIIFALMAIAALIWFIREDLAMHKDPDGYNERRNSRKRSRSQIDAAEEDRLLGN